MINVEKCQDKDCQMKFSQGEKRCEINFNRIDANQDIPLAAGIICKVSLDKILSGVAAIIEKDKERKNNESDKEELFAFYILATDSLEEKPDVVLAARVSKDSWGKIIKIIGSKLPTIKEFQEFIKNLSAQSLNSQEFKDYIETVKSLGFFSKKAEGRN